MRPASLGLLLATVVLFSGCSSNNKGKIEGTKWTSKAATVQGTMLPAGALSLEFKTDGSLIYVAGPERMTGKWSLGMGDIVVFNMDKELAGRKKHHQTVIINGNELTLKDSDGTTLKFSKAS